MAKEFQVASGSIVGTDHRQMFVWKNNQDALAIRCEGDIIVAVVADGCGEGAYSELGARLAAHLTAHRLMQLAHSGALEEGLGNAEDTFERLRASLILSLLPLAEEMRCDSRTEAVTNHFLFTLLAFVITPSMTYVVGIGDGVYAINGEVSCIGPFEGNEPPYLAYGGLVSSKIAPELCRFTIHRAMPTDELQTLCIGTDGAGDFSRIAGFTLHATPEPIGPLSQFWEQGIYFKNPQAMRRRLNLINRDRGHLKDDTTLVVVRRNTQPKD